MAGTAGSLQQAYNLSSLYAALDPKSLILSQFSNSDQLHTLQLSTDSYFMERGPRYRDYAALRESKLRMKSMKQPTPEDDKFILTPPKKQVKFQGSFATPPKRSKGSSASSSVLAQSVPDFSSVLRKENRKPPAAVLPPMMVEKSMIPPMAAEKSLTPPLRSRSGKYDGVLGKLGGGSKSANSGEKRSGGGFMVMARKSYANLDELKGLASDARSAINGENRGGRPVSSRGGVGSKTILAYRQF